MRQNTKINYLHFFVLFCSSFLSAMPCEHTDHELRYIFIKELLHRYQRPVTVLELQSCCGFYASTIAREFPESVTVILERFNAPSLLHFFLLEQMNNMVLLSGGVNSTVLETLAACEHFDLIIVDTSLWKSAITQRLLEQCRLLGDHLFLEVFTPSISWSLYMQLKKIGHEFSHAHIPKNKKLFLIKGTRSTLARASWLKKPKKFVEFLIQSSFEKKVFVKSHYVNEEKKVIESVWEPGINLITFKMLQGIYPQTKDLKDVVLATKSLPHDDWNPHNIIVQGTRVVLIDNKDPFVGRRWPWPEHLFARFMDLESPAAIKRMMDTLFKYKPKK